MATPSPRSQGTTAGWEPVAITRPADRAAEALWHRLCEGLAAPWLDEIRELRDEGDGVEASLDIWSVALTSALKDPACRETASIVLARLRKLSDETNDRGRAET